ncbi:hypothetical protein Tco_0373532 [Tanacetum coccineum]
MEAPDASPQSLGQAPPSPDYVPDPEHPPSPDYVPGPEEPKQVPPSLVYVPKSEYPKYFVPSDDEAPIEDQPLPIDASPTAISPGYVADSDPGEDPKEDIEEDHANTLLMEGMMMMIPPMMMMMMRRRRLQRMRRRRSIWLWSTLLHHLLMTLSPQLRIQMHLRLMSLHPHLHHLYFAGQGYLSDPRHLW